MSDHRSKLPNSYRRGHGFESRWSPDIFQASSFQVLKLEIYWEDHSSLSSRTAVQCAFHTYFTRIQLTLKTLFSLGTLPTFVQKAIHLTSGITNLKKLTCASLLLMFLPALKDLSQLPINYSKRENFIHAKKCGHNLYLYLSYKKLDKIKYSLKLME